MKLAPVHNEAERTLRNNSLVGFLNVNLGGLMLTLADSRIVHLGGWCLATSGAFMIVPFLVSRGVRLERESNRNG